MPTYTVRVVLHDADWSDYESLHEHMEAAGFFRFVIDDQGNAWELPDAEYDFEGEQTTDAVGKLAKAAAAATGRTHAVLVTRASQRKWSGLKKFG